MLRARFPYLTAFAGLGLDYIVRNIPMSPRHKEQGKKALVKEQSVRQDVFGL